MEFEAPERGEINQEWEQRKKKKETLDRALRSFKTECLGQQEADPRFVWEASVLRTHSFLPLALGLELSPAAPGQLESDSPERSL